MLYYERCNLPFKVINEHCFIIDSIRTKSAYKLNQTSTELWLLLSEKKNFDEIRQHFFNTYEDIVITELDADLKKLISEMKSSGLINEYH